MNYYGNAMLARFSRDTGCMLALIATTCAMAACVPASPVAPTGPSASVGTDHLPAGAFYLRSIDGAGLPVAIAGGQRIESGFVVADSATPGLVGFGESVGRDRSASVHLATGNARVVGHDQQSYRVASVTWETGTTGARADSVLWSADSVIVVRTGTAPSAAGAGHRLVYTRAVAADTL